MKAFRRTILILAVIAAVFLGLITAALLIEFDSPKLGRALLAQMSSEDVSIEADGFRLSLLRGLRLDDVRIHSRMPDGSLTATAESLVLEHRLGPLLQGRVQVEEIVLQRPTVEMVSEEKPLQRERGRARDREAEPVDAAETATEHEDQSDLVLDVKRFAIVDGTLISRVEGAETSVTEIHGLDLELRDLATDPAAATFVQGMRAEGELTADEVVTEAATAKDVEGALKLGDGHLLVHDLRFPTDVGRFVVGEMDVDLGRQPATYTLSLHGDPIRTHKILGGNAESGFGAGLLDLSLAGRLADKPDLVGQGKLAVTTGKLPRSKTLEGLGNLLRTEIAGRSYEAFSVPFEIRDERLRVEAFDLVSGDFRFRVGGSVQLETADLDMQVLVQAPRQLFADLKEIPKEALDALTDENGIVHLGVLLNGSPDQPKLRFDQRVVQKAVRDKAKDKVKKELGKALGDLFGKKKGG